MAPQATASPLHTTLKVGASKRFAARTDLAAALSEINAQIGQYRSAIRVVSCRPAGEFDVELNIEHPASIERDAARRCARTAYQSAASIWNGKQTVPTLSSSTPAPRVDPYGAVHSNVGSLVTK